MRPRRLRSYSDVTDLVRNRKRIVDQRGELSEEEHNQADIECISRIRSNESSESDSTNEAFVSTDAHDKRRLNILSGVASAQLEQEKLNCELEAKRRKDSAVDTNQMDDAQTPPSTPIQTPRKFALPKINTVRLPPIQTNLHTKTLENSLQTPITPTTKQ